MTKPTLAEQIEACESEANWNAHDKPLAAALRAAAETIRKLTKDLATANGYLRRAHYDNDGPNG